MKKLIITFAMAIVSSVAFSQIKVGGQLVYGTEIEKVGFGANGEIFFGEKFSVAPSITFFAKEEVPGASASFWELNADAHYYFLNSDAVGVYGLAGLNVAFAKVKIDGFGTASDNEVGLNIGAGASFLQTGKLNPFIEIKYETPFEQLVLGGGVRFTIKGK